MRDAANKAFWQKWAKWYAPAMRSSEEMYRSIRERIAPCLTKRMNVLEIILPRLIQGIGKIKKCAFAV